MAPKKTNIKIKHSKFNLYNKKKSKARRALKIIITVVVVCGLGVLGYGLGKPLLKYLNERGRNASDIESDTSSLLSSIMNSENSGSSGENSASGSGSESDNNSGQTPDQPQIGEKVYYLPENAAADSSSLSSALAAAKNSGCSVVAVTLKDTSGFLLYKSTYADIKDTETVTGTLSAAQIAEMISKEGFTPAARINTLMDKTGSVYVGGNYLVGDPNGSASWHDDRVDKGGKPWMSPFKTQSSSYIGYITGELSAAGFKRVICVNTRYPAFHGSDISSFLSGLPLKDSAKRVEALWNIINSAKASADKNGAELWLEISGSSLIAEKRDCTDAELAADKTKLKTVKIAVIYDITSASDSSGTSNTSNTSGGSSDSADDYSSAKAFAAKAKSALSGAEFGVRLPQSLTGKAREDVSRALSEAGITVL